MPPAKKQTATKSEPVTCKPGDIVVYDDGTDVECQSIVASCDENGVVGLHAHRPGKHGSIWVEGVPHYNQGKKGPHWKKAS